MLLHVLFILTTQSQGATTGEPAVIGARWTAPDRAQLKESAGAFSGVYAGVAYVLQPTGAVAQPQEVLDLLYRTDTFDGLRMQMRGAKGGAKASITVSPTLARGRAEYGPLAETGHVPGLRTKIEILETHAAAVRQMSNALRQSAQGFDKVLNELPRLGALGADMRYTYDSAHSAGFVVGRVWIGVSSLRDRDLLESAALGLKYRVLHNPSLAEENAFTTIRIDGKDVRGIKLAGDVFVPVQSLGQIGISAKRDGYDTLLSRADRTIRVTPFAWTLKSSEGEVPLKVAAINGNDGLVVPIKEISRALGL